MIDVNSPDYNICPRSIFMTTVDVLLHTSAFRKVINVFINLELNLCKDLILSLSLFEVHSIIFLQCPQLYNSLYI